MDDFEKSFTHGSLPVIRPADAQQFKRWASVLQWYGFHEGSSDSKGYRPLLSNEDCVLVWNDKYLNISLPFAGAIGGDCRVITSESEALSELRSRREGSILLLGEPASFSNKCLQSLCHFSDSCRWGFLSATDPAGFSFCLTKQFATKFQQLNECLDAIDGSIKTIDNNRARHKTDLSNVKIEQLFQSREWHTVVIHCHGDGAHARFDPVVLCGLSGEQELCTVPTSGHATCHTMNNVIECKRANSGRSALRFGDIRASTVVLLTCNGISVAGDIYPSNCSFALSVADGYPLSLLSTDRRLGFDRRMIESVEGAIRKNVPPSDINHILNHTVFQSVGVSPFVFFGVPNGSSVAVDNSLSDTTLAGHEKDALADSVSYLERRARDTRRFLAAFALNQGSEADAEDDAMTSAAMLSSAISTCEQLLANGYRLLSDNTSQKQDRFRVKQWQLAVRRIFEFIDALLSNLIDNHLLDGEFETYLTEGTIAIRDYSYGGCSRCGCSLEQQVGLAVDRSPLVYCIKCPTCGPLEAWQHDTGRIECKTPTYVSRGDLCVLQISHSSGLPKSIIAPTYTRYVVHLRDTGRATVPFRQVFEVTNGESLKLVIPIEEDSSFEMHTLRIAAISGAAVIYRRFRIPCVPSFH